MNPGRWRVLAFWALLLVTVFSALTSIAGGIAVIATDGLGMPRSLLEGGPFDSFLIPGIVLLVVIGGTQSIAMVLLILRRESALLWNAVAGFGMLIWIYIETGVIGENSPLQVLYFTTGSVQLILVLALLGVVHWLPRAPLAAPHARHI